jgi:DNA polymerase
MAVTDDKAGHVRAYLEYFRDMGVHDFYRNETLAPAEIPEAAAVVVSDIDLSVPQRLKPDSVGSRYGTDEPVPLVKPEPRATVPAFSVPAVSALETLTPTELNIVKLVSLTDLAPLPSARVPAELRAAELEKIRADIGDCTRCPLAYGGRRNIVFGNGDPNARLMFVGEGPGADEDEQGLPFVGKSGQLLNNMIAAMGLRREDVYIANIVKCRPPANRAPEPVEANTCTQFLVRQMDIVQPEVVVALGATAATYLLGLKQTLASLRGQFHTVRGAKCLVTFHPAFLLRDPTKKGDAWKDLQMVMAEMGLKAGGRQ